MSVPRKAVAAFYEVQDELDRAIGKFGEFHSPPEGYAVILEELDELWEEVRAKNALRDGSGSKQDKLRMRKEARQVAAMAVRFMVDLT